jgi:GT2 family glycosyltransferase
MKMAKSLRQEDAVSNLAPIVLFVYNRPEHTCRTLAALAANPLAIDSDLIIYADGAKKPEHAASVAQARDVVRGASGFKSVRLIERDRNWGLANSIIAGVSEVCAARDRVIVLEDDLLIAPSFLSFMNAGLDRYADENRVLQISGYMFPRIPVEAGAVFLPITSTWAGPHGIEPGSILIRAFQVWISSGRTQNFDGVST